MRKETLVIIGFLTIVLSTTAFIWSFAMPVIRPVAIPEIATATIDDGQSQRSLALTTRQVSDLNVWLRQNRRGWVPMTHSAPSIGDHMIEAIPVVGAPFDLRVWDESAQPNWARAIAVRPHPRASYRVRYCDDIQWASLKKLLSLRDASKPEAP